MYLPHGAAKPRSRHTPRRALQKGAAWRNHPLLACALTSAFIRRRSSIASVRPYIAAIISGVLPNLCHAAAECTGQRHMGWDGASQGLRGVGTPKQRDGVASGGGSPQRNGVQDYGGTPKSTYFRLTRAALAGSACGTFGRG